MIYVTLQQLKDQRACDEHCERFMREFGDKVEITEEKCLEYADRFSFHWALYTLVGPVAAKAAEKEVHNSPESKAYNEEYKALYERNEPSADAIREQYEKMTQADDRFYAAAQKIYARHFAQAYLAIPELTE
jgi:hypothetical protein